MPSPRKPGRRKPPPSRTQATRTRRLLPTKAQWKKWALSTKWQIMIGVLGILLTVVALYWPQITGDAKQQELQHSDLTNQITTLHTQFTQQLERRTKLTKKILTKVSRNTTANIGGEKRDPVLAAQADVALESGLSLDELKKRLTEENADVRKLINSINKRRAAAAAQADEWTKLQRDALTKLGDTEYAASHRAAIEPYRQALALIDEKKEPLVWCQAASKLEVALWSQGLYAEAEPLARRVVEKYTVLQGEEHSDTLGSVNSLANLLHFKGDYGGAEPLYRRVLEARERTLGKEHRDTLSSVNNLALLLFRKGDYADSGSLHRRALEAQERTLGKEHPDTLGSMNNLANVLSDKGDYAGAESLYRRSLEARERTLGKEHPDTLMSMSNLAALLSGRGDYVGAEPLSRRALEARERTLGKEHPDTLGSVSSLAALLLSDKGDYASAEPLFRSALEARKRTLGKEHPDTLGSVSSLATFLSDKGDYASAEPLFRSALEAQERTLGKEHPDTLRSMNNLANVLYHKGDYAGAESLYRRSLEASERTLRKETIMTVYNLSLLQAQRGRMTEALDLAKQAVAGAQKSLPESHPHRQNYEKHLAKLQAQIAPPQAKP